MFRWACVCWHTCVCVHTEMPRADTWSLSQLFPTLFVWQWPSMNLELTNCKDGWLATSVIFLTPAPQSPSELQFKLSELAFEWMQGMWTQVHRHTWPALLYQLSHLPSCSCWVSKKWNGKSYGETGMGREEVTGNYIYEHSIHVFAIVTCECEQIFCFSSPVGIIRT